MINSGVVVLAISGFVIGWFIPNMYRGVIEYKCAQRSRDTPSFNSSIWHNVLFGIGNMIMYGFVMVLSGDYVLAMSASILISLAVIITAVDIKIRLIPNELVLVLILMGAVYRLNLEGVSGIIPSLAGALIMALLFGLSGKIAGFNKVGAGDLKLAFAIGIVCASTNIVPTLLVMAVMLAAVSVGGILIGKLRRTDMIPFAGFMMAGMTAGIINSLNIF